MKDRVRRYIERQGLLRAGDRVGVAVSGGPDSVALLRVLLELRTPLGLVLEVVHFNHRIRGADADEDERFVRQLAGRFALECRVGSADVPALARERKLSLETAAREARYEFLEGLLRERTLDAIATGHNANDQAETVLFRFLRGAWTRGIAGIYPKRRLTSAAGEDAPCIVRPLLCVTRAELMQYLERLGQAWREDASNQELAHARNRIRHQVIPAIERALPTHLAAAMGTVAAIAREEEAYWEEQTRSLRGTTWNTFIAPPGEDGGHGNRRDVAERQRALEGHPAAPGSVLVRFALPQFRAHPLALQRRLLVHALLGLPVAPDFSLVERILDLVRQGSAGAIPVGEEYVARLTSKGLLLYAPGPSAPGYCRDLPLPGSILVPALGMRFQSHFQEVNAADPRYNRARFLEAQSLRSPLLVRNWRPGDRFWPVNTKAPEKVKRLLQQRRVSGAERALWPVVASGEEIVWMYGFGAAQDRVARQGRALVIEAEREA